VELVKRAEKLAANAAEKLAANAAEKPGGKE